jgi:hypothetical protein
MSALSAGQTRLSEFLAAMLGAAADAMFGSLRATSLSNTHSELLVLGQREVLAFGGANPQP